MCLDQFQMPEGMKLFLTCVFTMILRYMQRQDIINKTWFYLFQWIAIASIYFKIKVFLFHIKDIPIDTFIKLQVVAATGSTFHNDLKKQCVSAWTLKMPGGLIEVVGHCTFLFDKHTTPQHDRKTPDKLSHIGAQRDFVFSETYLILQRCDACDVAFHLSM